MQKGVCGQDPVLGPYGRFRWRAAGGSCAGPSGDAAGTASPADIPGAGAWRQEGRCDQMPLAVRDALRTGKEERSDGPPKQEKSRMPPASKRVRENIRLLHEGARPRAARRRASCIAAAAQGVGSSLRHGLFTVAGPVKGKHLIPFGADDPAKDSSFSLQPIWPWRKKCPGPQAPRAGARAPCPWQNAVVSWYAFFFHRQAAAIRSRPVPRPGRPAQRPGRVLTA